VADAAIVDLQMPGMDGLELARLMRADAAFTRVPLIMLTSLGHKTIDAKQAGVDAFLSKPIRRARLLQTLRTVLGEVRRTAYTPMEV